MPSFWVTKNLPSGIAAILHGFTNARVTSLVAYVVVVLVPAILVCPSNAGLYCGLFGACVSTGDGAPGVLGDLVDEHVTKNRMDAIAKNIFFI